MNAGWTEAMDGSMGRVCDLGQQTSVHSKGSKLQQEDLNGTVMSPVSTSSHFLSLLSPCITCPSPEYLYISRINCQQNICFGVWRCSVGCEAFVCTNLGFDPPNGGKACISLTPHLNMVCYPGWLKPLDVPIHSSFFN